MDPVLEKVNAERAFFDSLGNIYPPDGDVDVVSEHIDGFACYWFEPGHLNDSRLVMYLHGGGFALGSIQSHRAMVSHFSSALSARVLFIEYALAPEKPFPHGLNDVLKVYRTILRRYPRADISLIGDSAGGGLAASFIHSAFREGLKMPSGVVMISPWLNLRCDTESYETRKALDPILSQEMLAAYVDYYTGGHPDEADPGRLSFSVFPRLFILVGSNEIIFDDSRDFYQRIKAVQPDTRMKEYLNETHVWLMTDINSAGSVAALTDIREFLYGEDRVRSFDV